MPHKNNDPDALRAAKRAQEPGAARDPAKDTELVKLAEATGARLNAEHAEKARASNERWRDVEQARLALQLAAPALLESLERVLRNPAGNADGFEHFVLTTDEANEARAAVAKARGK